MMDDDQIEQLLRRMEPEEMPTALRERLADEPTIDTQRKKWFGIPPRILASAALLVALSAVAALLNTHRHSERGNPAGSVSLVRVDSTLIGSYSLAIEEHDGQLWELVAREWRDKTYALSSSDPLRIESTATRREIALEPVLFH